MSLGGHRDQVKTKQLEEQKLKIYFYFFLNKQRISSAQYNFLGGLKIGFQIMKNKQHWAFHAVLVQTNQAKIESFIV